MTVYVWLPLLRGRDRAFGRVKTATDAILPFLVGFATHGRSWLFHAHQFCLTKTAQPAALNFQFMNRVWNPGAVQQFNYVVFWITKNVRPLVKHSFHDQISFCFFYAYILAPRNREPSSSAKPWKNCVSVENEFWMQTIIVICPPICCHVVCDRIL